ncbi:MAG: universal stress protein [Vibrio sp.]
MSYQHILVAIDLTEESNYLLNKAISLAKTCDAKLSLIHIDVNFAQLYTGFVEINFNETQQAVMEATQAQIKALIDTTDYPIHDTIVASGDFSQEILQAIQDRHVDLVICGHHQDFWSQLLSTSRSLLNSIPIDTLIVPLTPQ